LPALAVAGEPELRECVGDGPLTPGAMHRLLLGLLLTAAALPAASRVDADPAPAHSLVAPALAGRVGRLAAVSGQVEIEPAGAAGWSAGEINEPIAADSGIRTAAQSRAAIEIGVDAIALSEGGRIAVGALDGRSLVIRLARGRLGLTLRRGAGEAGVELPSGEVWLEEKGAYDIDAGGAGGRMRVTAFAGTARLYVGGVELDLEPGEAATFSDAAPITVTIVPAAADAFAAWWRGRTLDEPDPAAPVSVSPDLTGFAALAGAGHWRRTLADGEVWFPDPLPADWAPYRDGHWRWLLPWGWTWIDAEPWGFAPFHYGRWARIAGRWAWAPGNLAANPVFVPAAVAFLGTPGIGVSYAGGSGPAIGWFPLAPGEVYWPSYSTDLDYIRSLNRGSVSDPAAIGLQPDGRLPVEVVDRSYVNRLDASVVPRPVFVGGEPVMPALIALPEERLREVPVVMGAPRIGPPAPPSPPLVAAAKPPAPVPHRVAFAVAKAKRARWLEAVRLATIRTHLYRQAAQLRHFAVLHLRAAAAAEPPLLRRPVALRVPHRRPEHKDERKLAHKEPHKRKIAR
jgi:hypothetical protein